MTRTAWPGTVNPPPAAAPAQGGARLLAVPVSLAPLLAERDPVAQQAVRVASAGLAEASGSVAPTAPTAPVAPVAPRALGAPLTDHLVRALNSEVIPRLAQAHRSRETPHRPVGTGAPPAIPWVPNAQDVDVFVARILDSSEAGIVSMVERLRRRGASEESIYLDLLAPAARVLGQMWSDDVCDFATVTLSVARLQRLMRQLSPSFISGAPLRLQARNILLAQAADEQHGLGLAMVAEFFRRAGWVVECLQGPDTPDPAALAQAQWFDVIGFSLGSELRLPWLRDKISAIRLVSRNAEVVVMVGGPLFDANPGWVDHVGADAWTQDARKAPELAARRVGLVAQRG